MSDGEYKKVRRHLNFLTIVIFIFILLAIANQIHTFITPRTTSFPKVEVVNGKNGKDAQVDYNRVGQLIEAQIAALPAPQNGSNGLNGDSIQGDQGSPGTSIQGAPGPSGIPGTDGRNGIDGLILQLQVDPTNCQLQDKYTVSDFWITIAQLPKPCGIQ